MSPQPSQPAATPCCHTELCMISKFIASLPSISTSLSQQLLSLLLALLIYTLTSPDPRSVIRYWLLRAFFPLFQRNLEIPHAIRHPQRLDEVNAAEMTRRYVLDFSYWTIGQIVLLFVGVWFPVLLFFDAPYTLSLIPGLVLIVFRVWVCVAAVQVILILGSVLVKLVGVGVHLVGEVVNELLASWSRGLVPHIWLVPVVVVGYAAYWALLGFCASNCWQGLFSTLAGGIYILGDLLRWIAGPARGETVSVRVYQRWYVQGATILSEGRSIDGVIFEA